MRISNREADKQATEVLAEIRAIKFAAQNGALSYESAKKKIEPLLKKVNKIGALISRKYGLKHKKITFQNL